MQHIVRVIGGSALGSYIPAGRKSTKCLFSFAVTSHYSSSHYYQDTPFPCQKSLEGFSGEGKPSISQQQPQLSAYPWERFKEWRQPPAPAGEFLDLRDLWELLTPSLPGDHPWSIPGSLFEGKVSPVPLGCCSPGLPSNDACLILKQLYSCTATMPAHLSPIKPPKNDS